MRTADGSALVHTHWRCYSSCPHRRLESPMTTVVGGYGVSESVVTRRYSHNQLQKVTGTEGRTVPSREA